jgi:hypothetical protein
MTANACFFECGFLSYTQENDMVYFRQVLLIFLLALVIRLVLLFSMPWENHIIDGYDQIALNMGRANGVSFDGIDPTVARAPVYPTYLFLLFRLFGNEPIPFLHIRLTDIVLDSFT